MKGEFVCFGCIVHIICTLLVNITSYVLTHVFKLWFHLYIVLEWYRVSLEVLEDGETPKPPSESYNDGLPKLYIHHAAFMKVLGATLDVDFNPETGDMTPRLFDREGHEMDPNA